MDLDIIITAAVTVVVCAVYARLWKILAERRRQRERMKRAAAKDNSDEAQIKKEIGTMDRILHIIGLSLALFTVTMIVIYILFQGIPDVLCTCFFAVCGFECGVMGKIQTNKEHLKQKQWDLEHKGGCAND